eukprot:GHVU01074835.1.p7 GENE.GHVU01074835.1~~GHVU01074835.1.p7  ORF type:complete len:106 (+),score=0.49 GHVU01074835.1:493-810(+)
MENHNDRVRQTNCLFLTTIAAVTTYTTARLVLPNRRSAFPWGAIGRAATQSHCFSPHARSCLVSTLVRSHLARMYVRERVRKEMLSQPGMEYWRVAESLKVPLQT